MELIKARLRTHFALLDSDITQRPRKMPDAIYIYVIEIHLINASFNKMIKYVEKVFFLKGTDEL